MVVRDLYLATMTTAGGLPISSKIGVDLASKTDFGLQVVAAKVEERRATESPGPGSVCPPATPLLLICL